MADTRKCATCQEVKPLDEFPAVLSSQRSRPHCKKCESNRVNAYRKTEAGRVYAREYMRAYRMRKGRKKFR